MEKELAALYNELANKIIEMIPTQWNKVYFLGEAGKGKSKCSLVFYYKENESDDKFIRQSDIKYKYNMSEDVYDKMNGEIQRVLLKIYDCFTENGQKPWEQLSMSFDSSGKFNVDFDYEILSEGKYDEISREVIWAYEQFGYMPPKGSLFGVKLELYLKNTTMIEDLCKTFEKKENVSKETYDKYSSILPDELLEIWERYGFGSFLNGYLKIIDPDEYMNIANDFYFREIIPVCVTGFGDIIYIEEDQHIGIIRCRRTKFNIIATNFKRFCECLYDEYYLTKYLGIGEYEEAVRRLGALEYDECFGYVPLLGAGGAEKVENLKKVKIKEHIEIIYQMFGKVK